MGSFLKKKDESFETFQKNYKKVQNEKDKDAKIISLRSDHRGELKNDSFKTFFD